jgi:hypothetical protein
MFTFWTPNLECLKTYIGFQPVFAMVRSTLFNKDAKNSG